MTPKRTPFSQSNLEMLAKIIGNTEQGLTGSEIGQYLTQEKIDDIDPQNTKWKRLFNAFANEQNINQCSNRILRFIQLAMQPARYTNNTDLFNSRLAEINQQLSFVGYELLPHNKLKPVSKASTLDEATKRSTKLKLTLTERDIHPQVLKYCKPELLQKNYFHAIFEAIKGLFDRLRNLSCLQSDGSTLVEEIFSKNPILIINNFQTDSEKSENRGLGTIILGLHQHLRNPHAHEAKINWNKEEKDALEILPIISYCHRKLDDAQRIR